MSWRSPSALAHKPQEEGTHLEQTDLNLAVVDRTVPSPIELDQAALVLDERGEMEVHFVVDIGRLHEVALGRVREEEGKDARRFDRCWRSRCARVRALERIRGGELVREGSGGQAHQPASRKKARKSAPCRGTWQKARSEVHRLRKERENEPRSEGRNRRAPSGSPQFARV